MTPRSTKTIFGIALGLLMIGAGCAPQSATPSPSTGAPEAAGTRQEGAQAKQDAAMEKQDAVSGAPEEAAAKQDSAQAKQDAAMEKKEDAPAMMAPREVKVLAKQFAFEPAEIKVKKGEKVKLVVTSDDVSHGLAIPAFNVNLTLEPGKTATAEFVADKQGAFPFFCSVFCGSGHGGMRGTLIVE